MVFATKGKRDISKLRGTKTKYMTSHSQKKKTHIIRKITTTYEYSKVTYRVHICPRLVGFFYGSCKEG
jgi:hypothetical protein